MGLCSSMRRHVFINEECENLIVVNDGGELTRNTNQKKKSLIIALFFGSETNLVFKFNLV